MTSSDEQTTVPWTYFAAVDDLDYRAVLALLRTTIGRLESYTRAEGWHPVASVDQAAGHPWLAVRLTPGQVLHIIDRIGPPIVTSDDPTQDAIDALGQAFIAAKVQSRARSITFGAVYAQWDDRGNHLLVEVSANKFLPVNEQLAFADEIRVLDAGLFPPEMFGPNWVRAVATEDDVPEAAAAVVRALAVFGITPKAILAALAHNEA